MKTRPHHSTDRNWILLALALLLTAFCATYWLLEGMESRPATNPPAPQKPARSPLPIQDANVDMAASAQSKPIAIKTSELK